MKFYILNNGLLSPDGMSGSDQRALYWSQAFAARGHSITMVVPEVGKERYSNFDCVITNKNKAKNSLFVIFVYLWRAVKTSYLLLRKLKADNIYNAILYSSSDLLPDAVPAFYAKIKNPSLRWISGLHLIAPNPFKGFGKTPRHSYVFPGIANIYYFLTQRLILCYLKKYAHTVMVSNSLDKEFLVKLGFSPEQVLVTYGAVDWQAINAASKQSQEYSACYAGRFHKQKGFPDLIAAWKKVCGCLSSAVLAVIGTDINLKEMIKLVESEGLANNIKFMGFLPGIAKFNVMKSAKLFVFPSTYESFGIVIAEAMACGLPVVAYDLPIYEEIYPEGMLKAKIGDIDGFAQQILNLLLDNRLRERLSSQAAEISKTFTWEKTAHQILERLS